MIMKTILLLFFALTNAFGQVVNYSSISNLQIAPQNPTTTDNINLTIDSNWSSGGCTMTNYLTSGSPNDMTINLYHNIGIASYICDNSSTISLGFLQAGVYTITCYINNINTPSIQFVPMSITFTVTGANLQNQTFEKTNSVIAYPNPVIDNLFIENAKSILILNALGQKIYENNNAKNIKQNLDFSNYQNGIYFLIKDNNFIDAIKIFKL